MKNIFTRIFSKTILLPVVILFFNTGQAQYAVKVSQRTYEPLTGATSLAYQSTDGGYYYSAPMIFPVFNRKADFNIRATVPSNGGFISPNGYVAVYETPGFKNTIVLQVFSNSSFSNAPGITSVLAKVEGSAPNRVMKFEWRNTVQDGDTAKKMNYQAWFSEADSSISYHFGPHTLGSNRAVQGYTGMVTMNNTFTAALDEYNLEGSPAAPASYNTYLGTSWPTLDSLPENGTVYTFRKSTATGIKENTVTTLFTAYPNPCRDAVTLNCTGAGTLQLSDIQGKILFETNVAEGENTIGTAALPAGVYIAKITSGTETGFSKIIKE